MQHKKGYTVYKSRNSASNHVLCTQTLTVTHIIFFEVPSNKTDHTKVKYGNQESEFEHIRKNRKKKKRVSAMKKDFEVVVLPKRLPFTATTLVALLFCLQLHFGTHPRQWRQTRRKPAECDFKAIEKRFWMALVYVVLCPHRPSSSGYACLAIADFMAELVLRTVPKSALFGGAS